MSGTTSLKISGVFSSFLLAAIAISLGAPSASAASARHRVRHLYANYGWSRYPRPAALPYGPEYGFLKNVPPNAVRGPGYTFVPGVGILGESCDLPTSACSNEYRDIE
jgi:hypothetical protein